MTSILQGFCSTQSTKNWRNAGFACLLLLAACGSTQRDEQLDFFALGTGISVSLYAVDESQLTAANRELQAYFATVGHDWYPWRPGELQRINVAIADGQEIDVSAPLASVIKRAAELELQSGNTFNAGLGRLTELWNLHDFASPQQLPDPTAVAALISSELSVAAVRWEGQRITAAQPALMLDLGGIAKGAILDACAEILQGLGIGNAIINIGGDLLVIGQVKDRAARVGIRSPQSGAPVAAIEITDGEAVMTSGNYERFVEIEGRRYTHILDPRTGNPVEHTASVTVVHKDAMLADAAATALMVGGAAAFDRLTAELQLEFALLIDASGDLRLTPAMQERLDWL